MLKRATFQELDLRAYEFDCGICTQRNVVVLGNREKDVFGAACADDSRRIWFESRADPVLQELSKLSPDMPREQYLNAKKGIEEEFLRTLPAASVCCSGGFVRIIRNVPDSIVICNLCKRPTEIRRWRDVSARYASDVEWWYSPD
jgi:hypothetical protein